MLAAFKELIANQFDAALCTLSACIDRCPHVAWSRPVGDLAFCQVAFHTLFYTDYYLGRNEQAFRQQPFHLGNPPLFGDYEELEDRPPVSLYDKASLQSYMDHCRRKTTEVIASETAGSLSGPSGFERRDFSRAELHVYNIRHVQHHAAQLSLRLRIDSNQDIPWIGSGWRKA